MNQDTVINLALEAMSVSMRVGMPMLLAALAVGLAVSIFQAVTQIQEQTLAFIPKVVALAVVVVIGGPWMLGQVAGFLLVLGRISPLFLLAPLFSSRLLPARARTVIALGLTIGIAPLAIREAGGQVPLDPFGYFGLMAKELLVGMAFSFALAALYAAVSVAGSLLDSLIGFSYGALVDPMTGNQSTVISQLYSLVGLGVFIAIGGESWVIQGLARTYDLIPLLEAPEMGSLVEGTQIAFAGVMGAAVQVCAPVLLAIVITDVAFGVVSRVVPQLNVFAVGFPAKVVVGVLMIGASLPFVGGWMGDELQATVSSALETLEVAG